MARKTITVYLDEQVYNRLRELIAPKTISRELDDLIKRRIAELEGREYNPLESADYEELKREYERLVKDIEKMKRPLQKRGVYRLLIAITDEIMTELKTEDISQIAPRLLQNWLGRKEDVHLFINLLEAMKKKLDTEKKLEEIRTGGLANEQAD